MPKTIRKQRFLQQITANGERKNFYNSRDIEQMYEDEQWILNNLQNLKNEYQNGGINMGSIKNNEESSFAPNVLNAKKEQQSDYFKNMKGIEIGGSNSR